MELANGFKKMFQTNFWYQFRKQYKKRKKEEDQAKKLILHVKASV